MKITQVNNETLTGFKHIFFNDEKTQNKTKNEHIIRGVLKQLLCTFLTSLLQIRTNEIIIMPKDNVLNCTKKTLCQVLGWFRRVHGRGLAKHPDGIVKPFLSLPVRINS